MAGKTTCESLFLVLFEFIQSWSKSSSERTSALSSALQRCTVLMECKAFEERQHSLKRKAVADGFVNGVFSLV